MNSSMRILQRGGMVLILGALLLLSGCAAYPLDMTAEEWNALTPEQQIEARESQKKLDRHDADERRCRREAERMAAVKVPVGGFGVGYQGQMEFSLGQDWERYQRCMDKAGWKVLIIDRTRSNGEGK